MAPRVAPLMLASRHRPLGPLPPFPPGPASLCTAPILASPSPLRPASRPVLVLARPSGQGDAREECPHCHRKFERAAFERHVPICEVNSENAALARAQRVSAIARERALAAARPRSSGENNSSGSARPGMLRGERAKSTGRAVRGR
jgi:hypothetical protein